MDGPHGQAKITKLDVPVPEALARELLKFWEATFGVSFEDYGSVLAAAERAQNHDGIYLVREGEKLCGACLLTHSKSNPEFALLGEVATAPEFRNMGISTALCERARDDFQKHGGQALFLGTVNPAAARVYNRLGWRKLAGCHVMACVSSGEAPEVFLVDYFREVGPVTITPGSAAERIPMIPLLVTPHDWQVLDANVGFLSTRYAGRGADSYQRYDALVRPQVNPRLAEEGRGAWFAARTEQGRLVGLSTARLDRPGECQVDGFTHMNFLVAWEGLIQASISWGNAHGATLCWASASVEDEDKRSLFETLGFREAGTGEEFDLAGRQVASLRLVKEA